MNKRIISGIAALALVFSSAVPAFAAENLSPDDGNFTFDFDGFDDDDASFDDGSYETGSNNEGFSIVVGTGDTTVSIFDDNTKKEEVKTEVKEAPQSETNVVAAPETKAPKTDYTPKSNPVPTTGNHNFGWGNNFTTYGAYKPYTPTMDKENADKIMVNYGDGITEIVTVGSEEQDRIFGAKEDWDSKNKEVQYVSTSPFTPWFKVPVVVPADGDKPDYVSYGYYKNPEVDENGKVVNNYNWGWGWFGNYWLNNMPVPTFTANNFNWFSGVPSDKGVEYYTTKDGESAPKPEGRWFFVDKLWYPTANFFAPQYYWFGFNNFKAPRKVAKYTKVKKAKAKKVKVQPVVKVVEKTVYVPVYTPVTNWVNTAFKPVKVYKKAAAPKFYFNNFKFGKNFAAPHFTAWTNVFKGFVPAPHQ